MQATDRTSRLGRPALLAGVAAAALTASGAAAQTVGLSYTGTTPTLTSSSTLSALAAQINSSVVTRSSTLTGVGAGTGFRIDLGEGGTASSASLSGNSVGAMTTLNQVATPGGSRTVDLGTVGSGTLGVTAGQFQSNVGGTSPAISATVGGAGALAVVPTISTTGAFSGPIDMSRNSIVAGVELNTATRVIAGALESGTTSATAPTTFTTAQSATAGNLDTLTGAAARFSAVNGQVNSGVEGATAITSTNTGARYTVTLGGTPANNLSAGNLSVQGNRAASTIAGNTSTSALSFDGGGATGVSGVVGANAQRNEVGAATTYAATLTGSGVAVTPAGATAQDFSNSSVVVTDNSFEAGVTGNVANNSIATSALVAAGRTGAAAASTNTIALGATGGVTHSADLGLVNVQRNVATTGALALNATNADSTVVVGGSTTGGSPLMAVQGNRITAASTANDATNVMSLGRVTQGAVLASNSLQENGAVNQASTVTGARLALTGPTAAGTAGAFTNAAVTMSNNTLLAATTGNRLVSGIIR